MAVTSDLMNNIDGNNKAFEFTFPYQNIKDIKVELIRSPVAANTTGSTTFTTLDHTKFKLAPDAVTVTLSAIDAPTDFQEASGAPKAATGTGEFDYVVSGKVYRDTDSSQLTATFYPGSAIRSSDLNNNFTQNLFVTQESEKEVEDNKTAVDRLVGFTTDNGATWVTTGGNTNASTDPKGLRYGINTADEARSIAATAEQTADAAVVTADAAEGKADTAQLATDSLVATNSGTAQNPVWVLQGDGSNNTQNNKGVKYAVEEADAAVASAAQANLTAGNAVSTADDAYDNAVRQAGVTPSGGANSAIQIAETAETNAANALDNSVKQAGVTPPGGANSAITIAENAETLANTANDNSVKQAGVTPPGGANAAITIAEDAYDNAVKQAGVTPSGGANAAITIAETAETTANAANAKALDVEDTVELYVADANGLRGDGSDPVTDPQGVAYAVRLANEASASVAASAIYKVVADLATLATDYPLTGNQPSPPGPDPNNLAPTPDGTFVQITDSTGISLSNGTWTTTNGVDFSGAGSFPNGFDGDSQLTLRVKVSNSTAGSESYVAQEYYANDPEARYGEDRKVIVESSQTISANYTIQTTMNAHSVGPVTIAHNGTDLTYNPENHAQPYVATNAATAGNTVTIPVNSTWLIS